MERKVVSYLDEDGVTREREHLVGFPVPTETLEEFYLILNLDAPIYSCCVVDDKGQSKLFIEKREEGPDVFRVFWRHSDIKTYVSEVKKKTPESVKKVLVWETTKDKLIRTVKSTLTKENDKLNIVGTAIVKGEFRDIDLFWSSCVKYRI